MTSEERYEKNADAYKEIHATKQLDPEEREDYFDEMLTDVLVVCYSTKISQDN